MQGLVVSTVSKKKSNGTSRFTRPSSECLLAWVLIVICGTALFVLLSIGGMDSKSMEKKMRQRAVQIPREGKDRLRPGEPAVVDTVKRHFYPAYRPKHHLEGEDDETAPKDNLLAMELGKFDGPKRSNQDGGKIEDIEKEFPKRFDFGKKKSENLEKKQSTEPSFSGDDSVRRSRGSLDSKAKMFEDDSDQGSSDHGLGQMKAKDDSAKIRDHEDSKTKISKDDSAQEVNDPLDGLKLKIPMKSEKGIDNDDSTIESRIDQQDSRTEISKNDSSKEFNDTADDLKLEMAKKESVQGLNDPLNDLNKTDSVKDNSENLEDGELRGKQNKKKPADQAEKQKIEQIDDLKKYSKGDEAEASSINGPKKSAIESNIFRKAVPSINDSEKKDLDGSSDAGKSESRPAEKRLDQAKKFPANSSSPDQRTANKNLTSDSGTETLLESRKVDHRNRMKGESASADENIVGQIKPAADRTQDSSRKNDAISKIEKSVDKN
ncbi:unnamed protein product [Notodromas monacha]|uniref:Uncharacterized protein n=1 Tax=Notodromas monacha TaxID=399045 RepID=A0A7R9BGQ1_9CRUS|nr:unnamed protein product [Notodromas monacha]CAG0914989.1 unnamed protein product [Notodromas monacha]